MTTKQPDKQPKPVHEALPQPPTQPDQPAQSPRDVWEELAAPFPADEVEKLPRNVRARDDDRGRCVQGSHYSADGYHCGGWHARAIHLDYVGHAGITMRLNEVLTPGGWRLEPLAVDPAGQPIHAHGEFWARLTVTVDGVEHSHIDLAENYRTTQEAWGDVLRRCAMRFGVGTYLWSKSDKATALGTEPAPQPAAPTQPTGQVSRHKTPPPDDPWSTPDPDQRREQLLARLDSYAAQQGIDREAITEKFRADNGNLNMAAFNTGVPIGPLRAFVDSVGAWVAKNISQQPSQPNQPSQHGEGA